MARWIGVGLAVVTTGLSACDRPSLDGFEDHDYSVVVPPAPRMAPFDYTHCESGAIVSECVDTECAEDGTEPIMRRFREAIDAYDLSEYIDVSRSYVDTIEYRTIVDYQIHVGWVRGSNELRLPVGVDDDEVIDAIIERFESFELPLTLAEPDRVVDALHSCLPEAPFDPCHAFDGAATAIASDIVNQGRAVLWKARVDTKTASILQCGT